MTAYDFIKTLLVSGGITLLHTEIKVCDNKFKEQLFDANVSRVDHTKGLVVLAAHLDYDNDSSDWIDNIVRLKKWFIANHIKPDYKIIFENHDSEIFDSFTIIKPNVLKLV